ncbi:MAG TPA: hypothetical protein VLW65_04875 [Bryobacteraceae bacterium]|nr:hypothetical protein [Bryobacteraceae bacterium]
MKLLFILVLSIVAAAQTPPPILRLIRNPNGVNGQRYANVGAAIQMLGMRAATGVGETWLIEQHPTFTSIEDLDKALGSTGGDPSNWVNPRDACQDEVLGTGRVLIAFYRDGWGYHSEDAIRLLPRARYINITIYRLRPDADADMHNLMLAHHAQLDSMNLNQPDLVYHIISGASSGLYVVLAPIVGLRAMDERVSKMPLEVETKQPAVSEFGRETLMFRIDPSLSYVSDEFAAADREFWRAK